MNKKIENMKSMKACIQVAFEIMIPMDDVASHGEGYPVDGFIDSNIVKRNIVEYLNRRHKMGIDADSDLTMYQIATWIKDVCPDDRWSQAADLDITVWQNDKQLYDGRKRPV